ncbi:MAG: DNA replication and repair protein RecF [Cytophagaceae bacterium]|jgi:DNA replication and repair protein RecF|nr:DNA replication and repair protein RecF [Cytophagaceae bacterium]
MYLEKLSLLYFKNYSSLDIRFSPDINLLTGLNGSGKTNLLDAIFCLCLTKSFLNTPETQLMTLQAPYFSIHGNFMGERGEHIIQYNYDGRKKSFLVDKQSYTRLSEHIGKFPAIVLTPYDTDMIRDGSEDRRKFFDTLFSQADAVYLHQLMRYQHFLKQRNGLLKAVSEGARLDYVLLETYDATLLELNTAISYTRSKLLQQLLPDVFSFYSLLSPEEEQPSILYLTEVLSADFAQAFEQNLKKDILLQRTGMGIHKDDFSFLLNDKPIKQYGSQGQQKTFMIALKLAQYTFLKKILQRRPILMMDDIFDKLDDVRIEKLIEWVKRDLDGQIFITDARPERSTAIVGHSSKDFRIFNIHHGSLLP